MLIYYEGTVLVARITLVRKAVLITNSSDTNIQYKLIIVVLLSSNFILIYVILSSHYMY